MKAWKRTLSAAALLMFTLPTLAATITIVPVHGNDGTGFYDTTTRAPVGGNPKTTVGEQRLFAARYVANLLGSRIQSGVEIEVSATFTPLTCSTNSGMLGHAGPKTAGANFVNAPMQGVYYPIALANALAGVDMDPTQPDIVAEFNSKLDEGASSCLQGNVWYYGLDGNVPAGSLDFVSTFAHELLHGLGFISFTDASTGELAALGEPDIFTTYIYDLDLGKSWPDMTDLERVASAINDGRLVWNGASATANGTAALTAGVVNGKVKLYAPNPLEQGSSVSHWDESLVPNALMEPYADDDVNIGNGLGLATCLLQDIGWTLTPGTQCPDAHVASAANLFTTPTTLDFGAVTLGDSTSLALTVSNTGDKPLVINNLVAPAAPYSITSEDCSGQTLFIGMQCGVEVKFTPTSEGTLTDTLGISSNAGTSSVNLTAVAQAVPAPIIQVNSLSLDFGGVELGYAADKTVSVTNVGTANLVLGSLSGLIAPFSVSVDACSGQTLAPSVSCHLTVNYAPSALGPSSGTLTIASNDTNVDISVSGTGVDLLKPKLSINPNSLDFGEVATGSDNSRTLTLSNTGSDTLRIDNIESATSFPIKTDSCSAQDIEVSQSCEITLSYHPTGVGGVINSLTIHSNDPTNPNREVVISGSSTVDLDDDGVTNNMESAGPHGGDADQDGTQDELQANVATLKDRSGGYVTLVTSQGVFANVQRQSAPAGLELPAGRFFNNGFFAFNITGITPGSSAEVTMTLPAGAKPTHYYKFKATDSVTTDVTDLVVFNGNSLVLTLTDGERGDADMTANGVIVDPGGPAENQAPPSGDSDSGGGGGAIPPWALLGLLMLAWVRYRGRQQ